MPVNATASKAIARLIPNSTGSVSTAVLTLPVLFGISLAMALLAVALTGMG